MTTEGTFGGVLTGLCGEGDFACRFLRDLGKDFAGT